MGVINPELYNLPRLHEMAVAVRCVDGIKSEVSCRTHSWIVDEPLGFGGSDHGAAPLEYILGSFAAVTNCMVTLIGEELDLDVRLHRVDLAADLDTWGFLGKAGIDAPFKSIRLTIRGETTAGVELISELREKILARDPVTALFTAAGARVEHDWRIDQVAALSSSRDLE